MQSLLRSIQEVDITVLRAINPSTATAWTSFHQAISDTALFVDIGVPVCLFVAAIWRRDRRTSTKGVAIAVMIVAAHFAALLIRTYTHRLRPYDVYHDIVLYTDGGVYSFPSGHAVKAAALAIAVSLLFRKWYFALPVVIWAGLVGYSRLYLGAHYPTDVLGAIFVAALTVVLLNMILKKPLRH